MGVRVRFDRSPKRIVNVANVNADYDYAVKKFFLTVKNRAQDSVQTWGEQQPVQIEARGVGVGGAGESLAAALSMALMALIEVDIAAMEAWLWRVGDVVKLTGLPHPTRAERGVVDHRFGRVSSTSRRGGGVGARSGGFSPAPSRWTQIQTSPASPSARHSPAPPTACFGSSATTRPLPPPPSAHGSTGRRVDGILSLPTEALFLKK